MSEEPKVVEGSETIGSDGKRTWTEQVEVTGQDAIARVKDLIQQGNIRRLIIANEEGRTLIEIPLTVGVVGGAALALISPVLAGVGAIVALLAKVQIRIVRVEGDGE